MSWTHGLTGKVVARLPHTDRAGGWGIMAALLYCLLLSACSDTGTVRGKEDANSEGGAAVEDKVVCSESEWKEKLTPEQFRILRQRGTEQAFSGKYWDHHGEGVYVCAGCGQKLFGSSKKFDSGTGWPSFWEPIQDGAVTEHEELSLGRRRTEVVCSRCGGHLGHVFEDGPQPTGLRYCINSAALDFREQVPEESEGPTRLETATFGAGCFWCTEALFETLEGVDSVKVGYMGGTVKEPRYKQVCSGNTGHAEVAQIQFDPTKVSYEELLEVFWKIHDPTTLNRQGGDVGTQYRSVIFYHSDEQKKAAERSRDEHQKELADPIVTEIVPACEFHEAEGYHQDYYRNNKDAPYCRTVIAPKLEKLK